VKDAPSTTARRDNDDDNDNDNDHRPKEFGHVQRRTAPFERYHDGTGRTEKVSSRREDEA
jgi:hypothetical protein